MAQKKRKYKVGDVVKIKCLHADMKYYKLGVDDDIKILIVNPTLEERENFNLGCAPYFIKHIKSNIITWANDRYIK